jgi:hypothetical protein
MPQLPPAAVLGLSASDFCRPGKPGRLARMLRVPIQSPDRCSPHVMHAGLAHTTGSDRPVTTFPRMGKKMKQKTSQTLYAYWNALRGDRLAPRRFEIEPARIASILPETFILEQTGDIDRPFGASYMFRLAGTRICEQFGVEFRGANFLDLWDELERADLEANLAEIASLGGGGVLTFGAMNASGRGATFEALILPLMHTKPTADRFLGAISCVDLPIWLGSERLVSQHVLNWDTIWPGGRTPARLEQHQAPFAAELSGGRIVRSDRRQFRVLDGGLGKTVPGKH